MRFLLAIGLLLPAPISAQDWNMGVEKRLEKLESEVKEIDDLKKRVDALEKLSWNQGYKEKTESQPPKVTGFYTQGTEWKGDKPTNNGREVLYFGADWCANCPSAISRLGELTNQIYYIDCTNDDTLAAMYRVDSYPSLIAIEDGVKVPGAHTEGDSVGSFLASKFLLKEFPRASSKAPKAIVRLEPPETRRTSPRASYGPFRASTGYRVIPVPSPTVARASVNRYPGPNWTWPGSLRTHLETAHGFSTAGFSEGELRTIHDNFHNTGSSGVVGARYSTPAPVARNYSPPRQSFPARVMRSFGSFCPTCPR